MRKKILIIDDDVISLELLEMRLKASGYDVVIAFDGQQGFEKARLERPDLIISDILLPRMDGFQLCQKIKEDPDLASIPIMMLTAVYVDEVDRQKGLKVGAERYLLKADAYMAKPFLLDRLLDNVRVLLGEKGSEDLHLKEKILVIDDDPASLELVEIRLEAEGYEVLTALDGEEGLGKVETEKPNLVLLDIQLPRMSGMDVLASIKEESPQLGVVMITAYGSEKIAIESMRKGANDYITKPINHEELALRVRENLEKSKLRLEKERLITILKEANIRLMRQFEELKRTNEELVKEIDKRMELERRIMKAEKMSTVGQFIAGAAHELNNPLAAIIGFSEAALHHLEKKKLDRGRLKNDIDIVLNNANRCKSIGANLLIYGIREFKFEFAPVDVNEVIEKSIPLVEYQTRLERVKIVKEYNDIPKIMANKDNLSRVFVNIMVNACKAMEGKGILKITTEQKGDSIDIIFKDTGKGIKKEHVAKVFDPFFTTRDVGKGTGLGLSVCAGIIKAHKGEILVESEGIGKGATFTIRLPIKNGGKGWGKKIKKEKRNQNPKS